MASISLSNPSHSPTHLPLRPIFICNPPLRPLSVPNGSPPNPSPSWTPPNASPTKHISLHYPCYNKKQCHDASHNPPCNANPLHVTLRREFHITQLKPRNTMPSHTKPSQLPSKKQIPQINLHPNTKPRGNNATTCYAKPRHATQNTETTRNPMAHNANQSHSTPCHAIPRTAMPRNEATPSKATPHQRHATQRNAT